MHAPTERWLLRPAAYVHVCVRALRTPAPPSLRARAQTVSSPAARPATKFAVRTQATDNGKIASRASVAPLVADCRRCAQTEASVVGKNRCRHPRVKPAALHDMKPCVQMAAPVAARKIRQRRAEKCQRNSNARARRRADEPQSRLQPAPSQRMRAPPTRAAGVFTLGVITIAWKHSPRIKIDVA